MRHLLENEPDENYMLSDAFQKGLSQLSQFDLSYDLLIRPRHLGSASELVKNFPDQRFIIDHIAKPGIKDWLINQWQAGMERIAEHQNVYCKISGMTT